MTSFNANQPANFGGKKSTVKLSRVSILEDWRENLKLNVVLIVILFLDSKAPLLGMNTGYV